MSDDASLLQRMQQAILEAFTREEVQGVVRMCLGLRFDILVADKAFADQVFELLDKLDRGGRVVDLLRCLQNERPRDEILAAACAGAEQRQAQVGTGKPIFDAVRQNRGPVPLQKPLRTQHFTDRTENLTQILADLQPGRIVTLCGPGGIGKSALAAEAIWTLSPADDPPQQFPDGIVVHTFYHQPQADHALEKIARSYGLDPRPTPRDAALQALAGRHALLVLDGAEEADDLKAVLAVTGSCGVLITTRRRQQAPYEWRDVAPLSRSDSLHLLRSWAGRFAGGESAAGEVASLLGGLPLALFLTGRYLAQQRQQASEFVEWLRETGLGALQFDERPSESVPLLLERSLAQVSAHAQAAFGVAGVLAMAPFEREIVAAALGVTPAAAGHALGELVDYGLLLRPDDSYLVTHALAHAYARAQAAPGADAIARLAAHCVALVEAESEHGHVGFAVLDRERAHVVAVQAAALKAGQWDAVLQIAWKLDAYLDLQSYAADRIRVMEAGLDAARAAGDRYGEGVFTNRLGNSNSALGNSLRAIELYEQCLSIARELGERGREGVVLGNLGIAYLTLGETHRAIELFGQALDIAREIGDRLSAGNALVNLGLAHAAMGDNRRAIELYEQSLAVAREIADRRLEGMVLSNWGNTYLSLGETRRAVEFYEQQLDIAREIGDRGSEGIVLGNLGAAYDTLGDTHRAVELLNAALAIARNVGDREGEAICLANIGRLMAQLGDPNQAILLCRQGLSLMQELGPYLRTGEALSYLGYAYHAAGEYQEALDLCAQAIPLLEETNSLEPLSLALVDLAETHLAADNVVGAVDAAQRAFDIAEEHGYLLRLAAALWALARAKERQGSHDSAVEIAGRAFDIYVDAGHPKATEIRSRLDEWRAG